MKPSNWLLISYQDGDKQTTFIDACGNRKVMRIGDLGHSVSSGYLQENVSPPLIAAK
jgi:hypothetical protein